VTIQKRSLKVEKLARIYDDEIAPVWGTRFGRLLLRNLAVPERGQVLDISCGTGYPAIEILRRMSDGSRLIAIDASSAMLDVARKKVADLGPLGKKGVFFRTESPLPKLSFADDVYDLVVCNLGLGEMPDVATALRDFARVAKKGGEVRCTLPLAGTFQEFHDIYREVLIKHDKHEALERLDAYIAKYPAPEECTSAMENAGLDADVEVDEFALLFKSSREFFFAPVIEFGPLADWKDIAGKGQELQDVFWYIKEAIDAYFGGRAFQVTVKAGCLIGRKSDGPITVRDARPVPARAPLAGAVDADDVSTGRVELVDSEELPMPPAEMASGTVRTSELDIMEIEEMAAPTGEFDPLADGVDADVPLDAFVEGKERPPHLDDD
jgi:ubiquinone/menaquinone biosynthesis C-methylase UbiE